MNLIKKLLAVLALTVSTGAMAGPITVDAGWYGFCFGGTAGAPAVAGCQNAGVGTTGNTFTFTSASATLLKVTDAFDAVDRFDVWVDSVFAFTTSAPGSGANQSNPDLAYTSGYFSTGSMILAAGSHSINILVNQAPTGGGGAYMEVETARVPVPGSVWLFAIGLLGLGAWRQKRA